MNAFYRLLTLTTLACSVLPVFAEQSQTPPSNVRDEMVIMAQRRAELIQDVPISVIAFTGEELSDSGVFHLKDLEYLVPGLRLPISSSIDNMRIVMRGVGSVGDAAVPPSVGTYIDNEYVARPGSLLNTLLDVEAVEALRGPQGVLYGRNSTIGVLNVRTKNPTDELEGGVNIMLGNFDLREIQGIANVPFSDGIGMRVAASYTERDGYGRNRFPGEAPEFGELEDKVLRAKLRIAPGDVFDGVLRFDYSKLDSNGQVIEVLTSTVTPANLASLGFVSGGMLPDVTDTYDFLVNQVHFDLNEIEQTGAGADLAWNFHSGHAIRSITSYRDWEYNTTRDPVRLPLEVTDQIFLKQTDTWSQEFHFLSPENQRFEYLLGAYYYNEDYSIDERRDLGVDFCNTIVANLELAGQVPAGTAAACAASPQQDSVIAAFKQEVDSISAFGQGTFDFNEHWALTAGIRWTKDDLDGFYGSTTFNPVVEALAIATEPGRPLKFSDDQTTYLLSLEYRPTDATMLYARYKSGYKSGGFNSGIPSTTPQTDAQRVFDSEEAQNFELGAKTAWLDQRVIANAVVFASRIDDFQDRAFDGIGFVITNAGKLDLSGVEFDLRLIPVDPLFISFSGIYLDSEFADFRNAPNLPGLPGTQDLTGQRSHFAPEWQLSTVAQWTGGFGDGRFRWFGRGEWAFVDDQNIGATTNRSTQTIQKAYSILNFRAGFGAVNRSWQVTGYIENAGDEGYCQVAFEQPFASGLGVRDGAGNSLYRCVLGAPRTYGVRASLNF